ncbi:uncharacterized protein LOC118701515 [Molothrus ater]|uniref:uncharacterized protein LOC118701515 n=1 Tax=Molothrus ater TaxID=84834 RepID=UPI00174A0FA1|nr:uncharacterized protein LOC118701515 [Molothrus ater]
MMKQRKEKPGEAGTYRGRNWDGSLLCKSPQGRPFCPPRLQLTRPLHLRNTDFQLVTVCPECPGQWRRLGRCGYSLRMAPYSVMFLLAIILWPVIPPASPWIIPQPRANVWRTLANALGQEHICLSMASAEDPMSTCLVGIPLSPEFEGLCCLNLSSRAEDARASIQKMQDMVHQIKQDTSDCLGDLFKNWGLSGWIGSILKTALLVLLVILAVLVASAVVWRLVKGLLVKLTSPPNVNQVSAEEEGQSIELQDAEDLHMDSELEGQDPQDVC